MRGIPWLLAATLVCAWIGSPQPARGQDEPDAPHNVFGQDTVSEAAMMGIFYDLKQTQDRKPTDVTPVTYWNVLDEFFSKGWSEEILNHYYRVSKPLYSTQVFIPTINADFAPKAFGAEKEVQPSRWVIHYRAQISPPTDGTYRWAGDSDDVIAVAIDGKTELLAPLFEQPEKVFPTAQWKYPENPGAPAANGRLKYGDWVEMKASEIYDLDVLIGERPGGQFNAFLMVQKQGETYEMHDNSPVLPIFQVGVYDTPTPVAYDSQPRFAKGFPVWKSYQ